MYLEFISKKKPNKKKHKYTGMQKEASSSK